jgi:hypothetical protein
MLLFCLEDAAEASSPPFHLQIHLTRRQLDISSSHGAVYAMLACINLYRLIPALLGLAAPWDMHVPLFKEIERPNDTIIMYLPRGVQKILYDAESFFKRCGTDFKSVQVSVTPFGGGSLVEAYE